MELISLPLIIAGVLIWVFLPDFLFRKFKNKKRGELMKICKQLGTFLFLLIFIGIISYFLPRYFLSSYPNSFINLISLLMFAGGVGIFLND